jgi:hypothetical protein
MYMIAFVTLMVALIGLYAQVYTKQVVNGLAQQSGVIGSMIEWHSTAVALATSLMPTADWTAGCSLTNPSPVPATVAVCPGAAAGTIYVGMPQGTYTACAGGAAQQAPCWTNLPPGYSNTTYAFYSIAFNSAGLSYVLTYVPPPASSSDSYNVGLLCLPGALNGTCPAGNTQFPTTFSDLYKQMKKSPLLSPMYYGTVTSAGVLTTSSLPSLTGGAPTLIQYNIPGTAIVPVGSMGIIAEIVPCGATVCL